MGDRYKQSQQQYPAEIIGEKRQRESPESPDSPESRQVGKRPNMPNSEEIMLKAINGLSAKLDSWKQDFSSEIAQLSTKIDVLTREWKRDNEVIVAKQAELEARLDRIERKEKRNNVVVTGLVATREIKTTVNQLFTKQLEKEIKVQDAFNIQLKSGKTKTIVKLENWEQKMEIMKNKNKLPKDVFVTDDLIQKDQFIQYKAREFARMEKANGKETKIGMARVYVNGSVFVWEETTQAFVSRKN